MSNWVRDNLIFTILSCWCGYVCSWWPFKIVMNSHRIMSASEWSHFIPWGRTTLSKVYALVCPQAAHASCLFSCNQHLCVVLMSASYRLSFLEAIDWMCFVVLETVVSCYAIPCRICNTDNLPGFFYFKAWFESTEDLVVVSTELINSLEVTLSMFRSHSGEDVSLTVVVGECVISAGPWCATFRRSRDWVEESTGNWRLLFLGWFGSRTWTFFLCLSSGHEQFCVETVGFGSIRRMKCQCKLWRLCKLGEMKSATMLSWSCTTLCVSSWGERNNCPLLEPFFVYCPRWGTTFCLFKIPAFLMSWMWVRGPSGAECLLCRVTWGVKSRSNVWRFAWQCGFWGWNCHHSWGWFVPSPCLQSVGTCGIWFLGELLCCLLGYSLVGLISMTTWK